MQQTRKEEIGPASVLFFALSDVYFHIIFSKFDAALSNEEKIHITVSAIKSRKGNQKPFLQCICMQKIFILFFNSFYQYDL